MDENPDLCTDCCRSGRNEDFTSLGSCTFTDEWSSASGGSLIGDRDAAEPAAEQRDLAQVRYYRDLIRQQMLDYQRIRLEEERFEEELIKLNEYSKELDQKLERVWSEAQEATDKNALFRQTYNTLMDQEESQIKRTAKYLQDTVPIRDELFETLCVTLQTEKHAIENAAELQLNYRRRMKDALSSRTRLQQKIRTFRHQFDKTQEQKRASYDEVMELLNEIDRLEAMEQLHCLGNPTN